MSALARETIADLLAQGISVRFQAHGDSMAPIIHSGDYLLVEPIASAHVRRGDVVLSLTARGLTAHRVIAIDDAMFTTRGDNASAPDTPFAARQLLGRVRSVEHDGRAHRVRGRAEAAVIRMLRRMWRSSPFSPVPGGEGPR
jgi:signal peptidase I